MRTLEKFETKNGIFDKWDQNLKSLVFRHKTLLFRYKIQERYGKFFFLVSKAGKTNKPSYNPLFPSFLPFFILSTYLSYV